MLFLIRILQKSKDIDNIDAKITIFSGTLKMLLSFRRKCSENVWKSV